MNKTIVANTNINKEYQKYLLSDKKALLNVQTLPFDAYFFNVDNFKQLEIFNHLKTLNLPTYFYDYKNFNDLIKFKKEMYLYNISLADIKLAINENNFKQVSLYQALSAIDFSFNHQSKKVNYVSYGLKQSELFYLEDNLHNKITLNINTKQNEVKYFSSLNYKRELNDVVNYIIKNNLDYPTVAVANIVEAKQFLKMILASKNIKYYDEDESFLLAKHHFITLLKFYVNQNQEDFRVDLFKEIIINNTFNLKYSHHILHYVNHYKLNSQQILKPFNYTSDKKEVLNFLNGNNLLTDENKINHDVTLLQKKLVKLLNCESIQASILYIFELLEKQFSKELIKIKNYLQEVFNLINGDNVDYIIESINNIQASEFKNPLFKLISYDDVGLFSEENLIICNLVSDNYPKIVQRNGLIDEVFLKSLSKVNNNFPTLAKRIQYQLSFQNEIFNKGKNLTIFSHQLDLEGKSKELVNSFDKKQFKKIAYNNNNVFYKPQMLVNPSLIKPLFYKDDKLALSASSIDTYVSKPYDFFLDKGLNLKKPFDYFNIHFYRGTLNHSLLEDLFKNKLDVNDLDYQKYFQYLPQNNYYWPYFFKLNQKLLEKHFEFLKKDLFLTKFQPIEFEKYHKLENYISEIELRGFIDRIDYYSKDDIYRIIDYKNGDKKFSKNDYKKGYNLQLYIYGEMLKDLIKDANISTINYYSLNYKKLDAKKGSLYAFMKTGFKENNTLESYKKMFKYASLDFSDDESLKLKEIISYVKEAILLGIFEEGKLSEFLKEKYVE